MIVNGKEITLNINKNLLEFLEFNQFDIEVLQSVNNGEIVPKPTYHQIMLKDEDKLGDCKICWWRLEFIIEI